MEEETMMTWFSVAALVVKSKYGIANGYAVSGQEV